MVFKDEGKQEEFLAKVRRDEEETRAKILAKKTGHTYLNLILVPIETDALALVLKEKAEKAKAVVFSKKGKELQFAAVNPDSPETQSLIAELEKLGYSLNIYVISETALKNALTHYSTIIEKKEITGEVKISGKSLENFQKEITDLEDFKKLSKALFESRASELVEAVLASALTFKASDIHFEPEKDEVRLRFRLDGVLEDIDNIPQKIYTLVLNRIKLLSGMKLNIREKAQDGRFTISFGGDAVEIRTSALPGAYGENIVMRILDPNAVRLDLNNLGIRNDDLTIINRELQKPTGMILTTGPTGSGKTTTLYAFIQKILTPDSKIITIEDPIEYHIEGISQTQVEPDKDYTFENGLRSIVRQDPDVILVGEIRDYETAEIAMQAAQTGHLVFSTLHTNDAVGAIPRLIDLGVKPAIIAPAVNLMIAQRLLRKLCPKCAQKRTITETELKIFKKLLQDLPTRVEIKNKLSEKSSIWEAKGCKDCHNGYKGRVAVMELFEITDEVEKLILKTPAESDLRDAAKAGGMVSMAQDAALKILNGETTIEEAERIIGKF